MTNNIHWCSVISESLRNTNITLWASKPWDSVIHRNPVCLSLNLLSDMLGRRMGYKPREELGPIGTVTLHFPYGPQELGTCPTPTIGWQSWLSLRMAPWNRKTSGWTTAGLRCQCLLCPAPLGKSILYIHGSPYVPILIFLFSWFSDLYVIVLCHIEYNFGSFHVGKGSIK